MNSILVAGTISVTMVAIFIASTATQTASATSLITEIQEFSNNVVVWPTAASPVAGTLLPIDNTALFVAGFNSVAIWMIPTLAGVAGAGIYFIKTRKQ